MREEAVLFGKTRSLVGIITDPHPVVNAHNHPAIVLLNAGVLHRVGPNRLYVKIARTLASAGFVVLRFDLSGIGDSKARRDNLPLSFDKSAVSDAQEAMDFLTTARGVQRFVLMGLCSGADNAFRVACVDSRVVGAVLINFYAVGTTEYLFHSHSRRLLNYRSWWRLITGKSEIWSILRSKIAKQTRQLNKDLVVPSMEKVIADLRSLVNRGVDLCFIYSASGPALYNYRSRFENEVRSLRSHGKLRVEFFSESDHALTLLSDQESVVKVIHDWAHTVQTEVYSQSV